MSNREQVKKVRVVYLTILGYLLLMMTVIGTANAQEADTVMVGTEVNPAWDNPISNIEDEAWQYMVDHWTYEKDSTIGKCISFEDYRGIYVRVCNEPNSHDLAVMRQDEFDSFEKREPLIQEIMKTWEYDLTTDVYWIGEGTVSASWYEQYDHYYIVFMNYNNSILFTSPYKGGNK